MDPSMSIADYAKKSGGGGSGKSANHHEAHHGHGHGTAAGHGHGGHKPEQKTKNPIHRLYLYFVLYCISQGIWDAYEESFEQPFFASYGLGFDFLAVAQTVDFLPWCIKFLWAVPTDVYNFFGWGHRRPFNVIGIAFAACAFFSLTLFNPSQIFGLYILCMMSRNIGIGLADAAFDGLTVDCGMDEESGMISVAMALGRTIGTVAASLIGGYIAAISFHYLIYFLVAMAVFVIPFNFVIQEEMDEEAVKLKKALEDAEELRMAERDDELERFEAQREAGISAVAHAIQTGGPPALSRSKSGHHLKRSPSFMLRVAKSLGFDWGLLSKILFKAHVIWFLLWVWLATLAIATAAFAVTGWARQDKQFSLVEIGQLITVLSMGALICELPLGYLFDRLPSKRITLFVSSILVGIANLAFIWADTKAEVFIVTFWSGGAHGAMFLVQISIARLMADERVAASFMNVVNSVANISHAVGTAIGGPLAESTLGLNGCFIAGGSIGLVSIFVGFMIPSATLDFGTLEAEGDENDDDTDDAEASAGLLEDDNGSGSAAEGGPGSEDSPVSHAGLPMDADSSADTTVNSVAGRAMAAASASASLAGRAAAGSDDAPVVSPRVTAGAGAQSPARPRRGTSGWRKQPLSSRPANDTPTLTDDEGEDGTGPDGGPANFGTTNEFARHGGGGGVAVVANPIAAAAGIVSAHAQAQARPASPLRRAAKERATERRTHRSQRELSLGSLSADSSGANTPNAPASPTSATALAAAAAAAEDEVQPFVVASKATLAEQQRRNQAQAQGQGGHVSNVVVKDLVPSRAAAAAPLPVAVPAPAAIGSAAHNARMARVRGMAHEHEPIRGANYK